MGSRAHIGTAGLWGWQCEICLLNLTYSVRYLHHPDPDGESRRTGDTRRTPYIPMKFQLTFHSVDQAPPPPHRTAGHNWFKLVGSWLHIIYVCARYGIWLMYVYSLWILAPSRRNTLLPPLLPSIIDYVCREERSMKMTWWITSFHKYRLIIPSAVRPSVAPANVK